MAKLIIVDESGDKVMPLQKEIILGRADECDVILKGPLISRRHARIAGDGRTFVLEDLDSSNGVTVNGRRVKKVQLQNRDRIGLGDSEMVFMAEEAPPAPEWHPSKPVSTLLGSVAVGPRAESEPELLDAAAAAKLKTRLKVLRELAEACCGSLEMDRLVQGSLEQLLQAFPQAGHAHGVLFGFAQEQRDLSLSAGRGSRGGAGGGISRTLLEMATRDLKAVLAEDVGSDERFNAAQSLVVQQLRSVMCCPLVAGDRVLGAIQVDTQAGNRPFTEDDLRLLVAVAGQIAVAAENARLHREIVAQQRLAAIGEAISSIAHCMKNTLHALESGAYVVDLGLKAEDGDKVSKGWGIVKRSSGFLSGLVRDMLAYCRKSGPSLEAVDAGPLLQEALLMVQESAAQKGVATNLSLPEAGALPLMADAMGLKRVVLNLLTNALEACSAGQEIRVSAERCDAAHSPQPVEGREAKGGFIRITVRDTGPGIPEDVKKRLFEPFFTTKGSRGTGLGLALVKKVVGDHGGRVEMESEVGRGTAFHLLLPMAAGAPSAKAAEGQQPAC